MMFRPTPGTAWLDIILLVLSGSILGAILFGLLSDTSSDSEYSCGGPGPADFGCTGGWEALLAWILVALQILFFAFLFAIAASRLISRIKNRADKVK